MTEDRWMSSNNPESLVSGVYARWGARNNRNERYDPERLRLFACACCRRLWDLLDDEHRQAVELLEKYARSPRGGGLARIRQVYRDASRRLAEEWVQRWDASWPPGSVLRALAKGSSYSGLSWSTMRAIAGDGQADLASRLEITARCKTASAVWRAAENKASAAGLACSKAAEAVAFRDGEKRALQGEGHWDHPYRSNAESAAQADLFRDIFRPSSAPTAVSKECLAWQDGTVVKLARAIDQTRDWTRLTVLADALEEAGCTDADLVAHCRSAGPHILGCWAVDILLKRPVC